MSREIIISAVVVTWNAEKFIRNCIESLLAQTVRIDRIIVVDNASRDDTVRIVRESYPAVQLIVNSTNLGFAEANNIGIRAFQSDWVLALNPDAYLKPDFVERLLAFATIKPAAGMLGGTLLRVQDDDSAGPVVDSLGIDIYTNRLVVDRNGGSPLSSELTEPFRVFGVCAAAALYRCDMLEVTVRQDGYFPAEFFSYLEDVDLSWRCWSAGWEAWIVPTATGWHIRGGSPTGSRFSRELIHRNRYWLIARNESFARLFRHLPAIFIYELFLFFKAVRHPYLFKAFGSGIAGIAHHRRIRLTSNNLNPAPPPFTPGGSRALMDTLKEQIRMNTRGKQGAAR